MSRTKPLDFTMHGVPKELKDGSYQTTSEAVETLVTQGFETVLERGGYGASFRDKGGIMWNALL